MSAVHPVSAADRTDIADLFARFSWAVKTNRTDAYTPLFTPDGCLQDDRGSTEPPGIADWLRQRFGSEPLQLWTNASRVRGAVGGGRASSFAMLVHRFPTGATAIAWAGHLEDTLQRADGRWLFLQRRMCPWAGSVLERFPAFGPLPQEFG